MKKIILHLIFLGFAFTCWAQAPQSMSYQAILRNQSLQPLTLTHVGMRISILKGSAAGTAVYVETHDDTTNAGGLVSLQVGLGKVVSGSFANIDWSKGPYFLKTETDPTGGTTYTITGTSQLMSVPYALFAKAAGSLAGGWEINGNSGLADSNFLGTKDIAALNFRIQNHPAGRIDSVNGSTYLGYLAGNYPKSTGIKNSAFGFNALMSNTSGVNNAAFGNSALKSNTSGSNNTATGFCQLTKNTTGGSNAAYGTWALFNNTTASFNVAIGDSALYANTTSEENVAVGYRALAANDTGDQNVGVGIEALLNNTSGEYNTAVGASAMELNSTGDDNTAVGYYPLYGNTSGIGNSAYGAYSMYNNTSGNFNTAVGDSAMFNNTTGSGNTVVGYHSYKNNYAGKNNTVIGYNADSGPFAKNTTVVGYGAHTDKDNVIVLGNYLIRKIYCAQPNITTISDGRFKKNVATDIHGLDFIMKLRPVSYNLDISKLSSFQGRALTADVDRADLQQAEGIVHNGFIAQEVEQAAKSVGYNFSGLSTPEGPTDTYGLGYTDFVVPLVKAVQELNDQNSTLKAEVEALKTLVNTQSGLIAGLQQAQANTEKELIDLKNRVNPHK
ncbi:MAG TPA: tail fiber domain-containing protein [Saprospiraceae bacterium]|nr:tail fiber domain-containing protein [Saprospiraceae bacterium]